VLWITLQQPVSQRKFLVNVSGLLRAVTDEQLLFNSVVEITGLLESTDVDLEESS